VIGDDLPDLAWIPDLERQVRVARNLGGGNIAPRLGIDVDPVRPEQVLLVDLDRDGRSDFSSSARPIPTARRRPT